PPAGSSPASAPATTRAPPKTPPSASSRRPRPPSAHPTCGWRPPALPTRPRPAGLWPALLLPDRFPPWTSGRWPATGSTASKRALPPSGVGAIRYGSRASRRRPSASPSPPVAGTPGAARPAASPSSPERCAPNSPAPGATPKPGSPSPGAGLLFSPPLGLRPTPSGNVWVATGPASYGALPRRRPSRSPPTARPAPTGSSSAPSTRRTPTTPPSSARQLGWFATGTGLPKGPSWRSPDTAGVGEAHATEEPGGGRAGGGGSRPEA